MEKNSEENLCEGCGKCECERTVHRPQEVNDALIKRLNRIEGQIRGIKGMIEKGTYCDDVLTQVAAAKSALNAVGIILLKSHIKTCVAPRLKDDDDKILEEFIYTVERMVK